MHFRILVTREAAVGLTAAWREEHDSYYGRPHGSASLPHQDGSPVLTLDGRRDRLGWSHLDGTEQWLASSGNCWQVVHRPDGLTSEVAYWGRRHGQRWLSREFIEGRLDLLAYETSEPTWPLWATADDVGPYLDEVAGAGETHHMA